MPTTKPRRRTVARDQLAAAYQPDPTVCRCKPVTVATFRAEQLDVAAYQATLALNAWHNRESR